MPETLLKLTDRLQQLNRDFRHTLTQGLAAHQEAVLASDSSRRVATIARSRAAATTSWPAICGGADPTSANQARNSLSAPSAPGPRAVSASWPMTTRLAQQDPSMRTNNATPPPGTRVLSGGCSDSGKSPPKFQLYTQPAQLVAAAVQAAL